MLVTSRSTKRWVIPKGWPWPDHNDWASAAGEAHEEAGLAGSIEQISFGRFAYAKRTEDGNTVLAVDVYLLWVETELEDWPEREERERAWFTPEQAARSVDEPQLRGMIRALPDLPRTRGKL